jgi:hypothetical protein
MYVELITLDCATRPCNRSGRRRQRRCIKCWIASSVGARRGSDSWSGRARRPFESRIQEVVAVAEEAAARADAWDGLTYFLHRTIELQVADRGLREALVLIPEARHHMVGRDRLKPVLAKLLARAQADGALRRDVETTDLAVLFALLSSVATSEEPQLWRRSGRVRSGRR